MTRCEQYMIKTPKYNNNIIWCLARTREMLDCWLPFWLGLPLLHPHCRCSTVPWPCAFRDAS
jgi:hypothetical protein